MRHRSRGTRRGLQAEAATVRHPSSEEEAGMSPGRLPGRRKPASRTPAEPVPGLSRGSLPPDPASAPRGRAGKLLSPSSGSSGGHGAVPAGSRRAASPWRRLALLPVLALLAGAFLLLDIAPAAAQTPVWSATLTVHGQHTSGVGCDNENNAARCRSVLSSASFTHDSTQRHIYYLFLNGGGLRIMFSSGIGFFPVDVGTSLDAYQLCVGSNGNSKALSFSSATHGGTSNGERSWSNTGLSWSVGDTVPLSIQSSCPTTPTVSLSATPNPVTEGSPVTVTATLSSAATSTVTIPLTVTAGTAETGDYMAPTSITIAGGSTTGTGTITTAQDADFNDETFTVALGTLPSGYSAGSTSSVTVTIRDDEAPPKPLTLRASGAPREGGGPVTVTATLDKTFSREVQVVVNLGGTASWLDSSHGTRSGTDYWTPVPAGRRYNVYRTPGGRAAWFTATPSARFTQAAALLTIPAGSRSVIFEIHVLDDAHEDSGETIEIEVQAYENIPFTASQRPEGWTGPCPNEACRAASWMKYLTGASDTLTLTIANHEDAETEAARLAAEEAAKAEKQRLAAARAAAGGPLSGLALMAGSQAVALVPAFSPGVTYYRAEVPAGTAGVSLAPSWGAEAELGGPPSLWASSRGPESLLLAQKRVHSSGGAAALALAPNGPTRLELTVIEPDGSGKPWQGTATTYRVEVVGAAVQTPEERTPPEEEKPQTVTVAFGSVPPEHDGRTPFALEVQSGSKPAPEAFRVTAGKVTGVESLNPALWRVRVAPKSWKDVTVALGGASATVRGPARVRVADARAKEGRDASLDFAVTLSRAAAHAVSVDYATADGAAKAGADYTAASGTLVFAPGETAKTVSVAILDDAVDEGKETFTLRLSNPRGAFLRAMHREAKGVIRNSDPMPVAWLARFGRTAAENVVEAVGARIEGGAGAARMVLGGQELGLDGSAGREALLARLAERYRREAGARLERGEYAPPPVREVSMSELLLASSFHMASAGDADASPGRWSVWGRGARSSFSGKEGVLTLEGDVTTAALGADYERARWLVGVALARSSGDGSYRADGAGGAGGVESTLTGVYPYARYRVSGSFSLWGVVGLGSGEMTLTPGGAPPVDADVDMGMAAGGARGVLLPARAPGGFELALRADVLVTDTRSDAAADLAETEAGTSRVRLALEGSRSLRLGDAVLTPSVEIGFRNDSGDAETGGGVEAGGGLRWSSGALTAEVRARGLIAHGEGGYEEWGVSASVGYAPGADGRGLSLRAGSSWGAAAGGAERLWSQAAGLSPGGAFEPGAAGFDAEAGWGLDAWGGLLTPYTGFTLTGSGETYRAGGRFRLAESLTMSLEGDLRERDGGASVHGVALKGSMRW